MVIKSFINETKIRLLSDWKGLGQSFSNILTQKCRIVRLCSSCPSSHRQAELNTTDDYGTDI